MQRDLAADVNIRPLIADNLSDLIRSTCVFSKQPALSLIAVSHYSIFHISFYENVTIGIRAKGAEGCSPPELGQNHYFRAKAKFSGRSQSV